MTSGPLPPGTPPGRPPGTPPGLPDDILLLAAFLLSSGRGLLDEPAAYGPARCADGARRTLEILERTGPPDPRLTRVREQLEDALCGPMADVDLPALLETTCEQLLDAVTARRITRNDTENSQRPGRPG